MFFLLISSLFLITHDILPLLPYETGATECIETVSGGGTNENFHLALGQDHYFVRFGNEGASLLGANIENEYICTKLTVDAGLAPPLFLFLPEKKVLVSSFIPSSKEVNLRELSTLSRLAKQVKILHRLPSRFPKTVDPLAVIQSYHTLAMQKGIAIPEAYLKIALKTSQKLPHRPSVPCHLDLHKGNLIDDGHTLWLIDWEYASMADPLFDLAILSATEHFSDSEMESLLELYDAPEPQAKEWLTYFRILADLRWGYWCLIQEQDSQLDYPYREEAKKFLSDALFRAKQNLLHE